MNRRAAVAILVAVLAGIAGTTFALGRNDPIAAGPSTTPSTATHRVADLFDPAPAYPGLAWTRAGKPVAVGEVSAAGGPDHCEWQSATLIHVSWPLGTVADGIGQAKQYVRDPDGVISPALQRDFRAKAALPATAYDTGYRVGGYVELWLVPTEENVFAYLVNANDRTDIERWRRPGDPGFVACA